MNQPDPPTWTIEDAKSLYAVDSWSGDYFDISSSGDVTVRLRRKGGGGSRAIPLLEIVKDLREQGIRSPMVLRFGDLIESRIQMLNESFKEAIREEGYEGKYHGVFPIKVNQQRQVMNQVTRSGRPYQYGLETGSKAEFMAAAAYMKDRDAYLVCNGYKDAEFIGMALRTQKMGLKVILVVEMPRELDTILEIAAALGVEPMLGIRVRLAAKSAGYWSHSAGEESVFGLHITQVMGVVDKLRDAGKLHCVRMLHFHQGSQIPNIHALRQATIEATRIYADLVNEGATMGLIDLGGGLAVGYEGEQSGGEGSPNYGIKEYCADVVHVIKRVADEEGVAHPDIISESGRAVVAHCSVLVFDIVDVNRFFPEGELLSVPEDAPDVIRDLGFVAEALNEQTLQECFNDTIFYRDQLRQMHLQGTVTLRERSLGEHFYAHLMKRFAEMLSTMDSVPEGLQEVEKLSADFYYGNFSLFRSISDAWGIDQLFPVVPLHRLGEEPTRRAILADLTCDCDGRLHRFLSSNRILDALPVHELREKEDYIIGVFLVGAYQEALGGLHNLFGRTNIVSVALNGDDQVEFADVVHGDSAESVLSLVNHNPEGLRRRYHRLVDRAIAEKRITEWEGSEFATAYEEVLSGYTYFKNS